MKSSVVAASYLARSTNALSGRLIWVLVLGLVVTSAVGPPAYGQAYTFIDMQDVFSFYRYVRRLNHDGYVVRARPAALWRDGELIEIGIGTARGVNNLGQVVGDAEHDGRGQ